MQNETVIPTSADTLTVDNPLSKRIAAVDWSFHGEQLQTQGYTLIRRLLTDEECSAMIALYDEQIYFRKTVNMARHRFGLGEYKYYKYPLPSTIGTIRSEFYPHLARVANAWNAALHIDQQYPSSHEALLERCRIAGQLLPTALMLKYGAGGYNTLHQDLYGEVYFPMQTVFLLNDPKVDFDGGNLY